MERSDSTDTAEAFNVRAQSEGWPARCDEACAFDAHELADVHGLWSARACGGRIPAREEFNLRSLKAVAAWTSIVQREVEEGDRRYRLRLIGSALARVFGENSGRLFDEFIPQFLLPSWLAGYDLVLARARPLRFQSWYRVPGADLFKGETISAPVRGAGEQLDMILSVTHLSLKDGSQPSLR